MTPIHENGWKGERDRAKLMLFYQQLALNFMFKPLADWQLAKLTNHQLDRLCRDTWDRQPSREQRWYAEKHKMQARSGEFAWRWFWRDLFHPPKRIKPPKPSQAVKNATSEVVEGAKSFVKEWDKDIPFVGAAD